MELVVLVILQPAEPGVLQEPVRGNNIGFVRSIEPRVTS